MDCTPFIGLVVRDRFGVIIYDGVATVGVITLGVASMEAIIEPDKEKEFILEQRLMFGEGRVGLKVGLKVGLMVNAVPKPNPIPLSDPIPDPDPVVDSVIVLGLLPPCNPLHIPPKPSS